jgi:5-formyltetrahydrofolate cyclo-ligase
LPFEADTARFIEDNKNKYKFYFPHVSENFIMTADKADKAPGITVTPLIGFNGEMHRIGFGKGCYDRYFALNPETVKIGLAYSAQYADFKALKHDVKLDYIITDRRIF